MKQRAAIHANIHGHVQGVFFRAFVSEKAAELGLKGYVRNLPSLQDVEVVAEGEKENLDRLVEHLRKGPPAARVEDIRVTWSDYSGKYSSFEIRY
jgi:acylphosphatase